MDILFYADSRGRQPVYDWIKQVEQRDKQTYRKTMHLLRYLKENGKLIRTGEIKRDDMKRLNGTDGIWQLRVNQNRILFFYYSGDSIVLTNQFKKKQNKTPAKEIKLAERKKKKYIQ